MRSLYILRHAKADRDPGTTSDHERALKRRGRKAAATMGRFLTRIGQAPDLVLSSSAVRARETAELAREAGGWEAPLEVRATIYEGSAQALLAAASAVDDSIERLLLVGHQPELSLLIARLTGGAEPAFPTAALARVDLAAERWRDVQAGAGTLCWLVTPDLIEPPEDPDA